VPSWGWDTIDVLSIRLLDEAAFRKFVFEAVGIPAPGKTRRKPRVRVAG
jgi:hypothetical protein